MHNLEIPRAASSWREVLQRLIEIPVQSAGAWGKVLASIPSVGLGISIWLPFWQQLTWPGVFDLVVLIGHHSVGAMFIAAGILPIIAYLHGSMIPRIVCNLYAMTLWLFCLYEALFAPDFIRLASFVAIEEALAYGVAGYWLQRAYWHIRTSSQLGGSG